MYSQHNQRILQIFDFLNNAYRMQKNSQREREREREMDGWDENEQRAQLKDSTWYRRAGKMQKV